MSWFFDEDRREQRKKEREKRRKERNEELDNRREDRKIISGNRKWIVLGIAAILLIGWLIMVSFGIVF